ncbi:MAG: hypothetical protein AAFR07_05525 [Pseudomonadota bacterium]
MTESADYKDKRSRMHKTSLVQQGPVLAAREGYLQTPRGIVIFAVIDTDEMQFTILRTSHGGRVYLRHWEKSFRDRYLKTLANRFIDDVMNDRIGG